MRVWFGLATTILMLGGCADAPVGAGGSDVDYIDDLPDSIRLVAAPGQNLDAVRLRSEDGCFWYRHVGPVETTELPLRSVDGRPICAAAPGEAT